MTSTRIRAFAAAALVAGLLASAAPATAARLSAFHDVNANSVTRGIVTASLDEGATGYVGSLDVEPWVSVATVLSILHPLTSKGAFVALGNHDSATALSSLLPQGKIWSRSVGGARIVGADTNQRIDVGSAQFNTVRNALCNAPEAVRILVLHAPWWLVSGAVHPGSQFPGSPAAMDQMVKDCRVGLVLAGHEHNYQRLVRNGAEYVVAGIGGQASYPLAGSPPGTVFRCQCGGRLVLDVSSTGYTARLKDTSGRTRDTFTYSPPATGSGGGGAAAIAFSRSSGNEWWAQVYVGGSDASRVIRVEAADSGGPFVPLVHRSWGAWAASFHVEPGHTVQYRAILGDGRTALSCAFTHPAGVCATGAGGAFSATFVRPRGNAYWIECEAQTSGGTLAGVDARIDNGAFFALTRTAWGSWAKGVAVPSGAHVELRARSTGGAIVAAAPMVWPPA